MTLGTGIAIAAIWMPVSISFYSDSISSTGVCVSILAALAGTGLVMVMTS